MSQRGHEATCANISEAGNKCVCLNARSIVNKKNKLNIMVEDTDHHIHNWYKSPRITKSWANKDTSDA